MSYMDRALKSKDPRFAQVLGKLGYERRDMVDAEPGIQGEDTASQTASQDEMTELRAEYKAVVGKRAYPGWDAATLREKIAEANASEG